MKPDLSALGSGITLQGNALRVFDRLGVWEQVKEAGYSFDQTGLRAPGPDAPVIAQIPDAQTGGPEYPAVAGMYRPDLARILADRATELGARIHYGTTVTSFTQDDDGVDVTLSDGSTGRYDLLIGADGLNSDIRKQLGIEVEPERTGMGIWRAFVPRPKDVTQTDLYYGGPVYIAGYCPTSEEMMYAYLVEPAQDRHLLSPEEGVQVMKELSQAYGGPWNEIRESLDDASRVNYTWFTQHVVPDAWNRGRVVIIGEAAHSCPPTIAQGAAQAAEDAARALRAAARARRRRPVAVGRVPRAPPAARDRGRRGIRAARPVADRPRAGRRRAGPDAPHRDARERAGMSAAERRRTHRAGRRRARAPAAARAAAGRRRTRPRGIRRRRRRSRPAATDPRASPPPVA